MLRVLWSVVEEDQVSTESLFLEYIYHFINCAILTVVVSIFVLLRYRVAVFKGMMRPGTGDLPLAPLQLREENARNVTAATMLIWEKRQERGIALAYLLSVFICLLPLGFAYEFRLSGEEPFWPSKALMFALIFTFACAPMIATSLALPLLRALAGLVLLTALLTALTEFSHLLERLLRGLHIGWRNLMSRNFLELVWDQLWFIGPFSLLFWPRKLRGVAPITFAALLLFSLAPFIVMKMQGYTSLGGNTWLGLDGTFVLLSLPVGWLAWTRLHQVARGYARKRFSDAQLLSRTWWLIVMVMVGIENCAESAGLWLGLAATAAGLFAFAPVNNMLLSNLRQTSAHPAPNLLLLRMFGYTARTERLFDRICGRWRLLGPVTMIAAPDVVARTIGPGDYLRWLTGRVDELFVNTPADLIAKLGALDVAPDPDGRYRVNAFCCRSGTWQATVVELIQRADAVVMDLRGLTRGRHGCEFELQELRRRLPLWKLVLVVDTTTERAILDEAFGQQSNNVRLVEVRRSRNTGAVFEALVEAAA
jgi:hypothetical protein